MPYIIVVIALVVASVGFTLFQSSHSAISKTPSEPIAVEHQNEIDGDSALKNTLADIDISTSTETHTEIVIPVEDPKELPSPTPQPTPSPAPTPVPTPMPKPAPTPVPVNTNTYTNGTYSTQASYRTPGGQYQINVAVSVSNDKITNTTVTWNAGGGDSYSKAFNRSYQNSVIGQDLGTIHPSRIGGASLTTRAFNNALDTIRAQAA